MELRRVLVPLVIFLALSSLTPRLSDAREKHKWRKRVKKMLPPASIFDPDKYKDIQKVIQILAKQPEFLRLFWKGDIIQMLLEALRETNEVTFMVPTPDSAKPYLSKGSPYYNNKKANKALLRYMLIMNKKVTFTDLVEDAGGTQYPTMFREPQIKSPDSVFFTVIFKTPSGRSNSSLAAPNLYEGKFIQLHIVSDMLIPDGLLAMFAPPLPSPPPPAADAGTTNQPVPMTPNPNSGGGATTTGGTTAVKSAGAGGGVGGGVFNGRGRR
eukprot:TRINITY_DN16491_c0_g1_i1.p3 TRINITY_DN16491_c0_g1~~TRINITY_DN16491_c0_g1_i1.p3  ORF type:complete len:269 (-),score=23.95 TRINITY_DN16491_c0_g1_i1:2261-3067(-)